MGKGNEGTGAGSAMGRDQGPKGHKGCLQRDGVRLTLSQTISMGMLPSLGMWPQCQHNTEGLCCGDSPVLA